MSKERLFIIEDDKHISKLIKYNLEKAGFECLTASSGEEAFKMLDRWAADLILLDVMLPGMDGLEACRRIKQDEKFKNIPVVMLTAKGEEVDRVVGFELGADDYIVKPFSPNVLIARIKTLLRRRKKAPGDVDAPIETGSLSIHPGRHEVKVGGELIELTNMEFRVLYFLAGQPGWVFTRYQIVESIRGENYPVTDRSVDVLITGLRKKLGNAGTRIETVRGVGYKFTEE